MCARAAFETRVASCTSVCSGISSASCCFGRKREGCSLLPQADSTSRSPKVGFLHSRKSLDEHTPQAQVHRKLEWVHMHAARTKSKDRKCLEVFLLLSSGMLMDFHARLSAEMDGARSVTFTTRKVVKKRTAATTRGVGISISCPRSVGRTWMKQEREMKHST